MSEEKNKLNFENINREIRGAGVSGSSQSRDPLCFRTLGNPGPVYKF